MLGIDHWMRINLAETHNSMQLKRMHAKIRRKMHSGFEITLIWTSTFILISSFCFIFVVVWCLNNTNIGISSALTREYVNHSDLRQKHSELSGNMSILHKTLQ